MEGTGFLSSSQDSGGGGGFGSSHGSSSNHSHHHHHGGSSGSMLPGAFLGAVGGVLGASLWNSRTPQPIGYSPVPAPPQTPYPQPYPPQGPYPYSQYQQAPNQPLQYARPVGPPPLHQRKKNNGCCRCCCVVLLLLVLWIGIMFVPVPGSSSVLLVAGDRKLEKISGSWFSDVAVGGATEVDTYLFHTKPPLTDVQHLSKHVDIKLERGSFHYVRYDLQPGSTVQITWKFQDFTQPPTFGIIEGTQMFNSWQTGGGARWSYDRNVGAGKYTFKAPHRESFYLVFYMQRSWLHATGVADFEVDSRTYAIEKPVDHCPAGSKDLCVFPLARNENSYLLFVAPPQEDAYTVTYRTHARWNVYFALIATASSMTFLCCVGSILARCFCGFGRNRASRDATLRQEYEALADESGSRTHHSASPLLAPGSAESPALPAFNPEFPGGANAPPAVPSAPPPYSVFDPTAR